MLWFVVMLLLNLLLNEKCLILFSVGCVQTQQTQQQQTGILLINHTTATLINVRSQHATNVPKTHILSTRNLKRAQQQWCDFGCIPGEQCCNGACCPTWQCCDGTTCCSTN
jgi:hypothetical protein